MKNLITKIIVLLSFGFATSAMAITNQEPQQAQEILQYWFGSADAYPVHKDTLWWEGGKEVDNDIRARFGKLVVAATKDELNDWKKTPRGRLALILLVDQFTRNIYRGTPQAFAYDSMAQKLTLEGLAKGDDKTLFPIERAFFYLPLEHAENIDLQKLSVEKFQAILSTVSPDQAKYFKAYVENAQEHYDTIKKFGRFPYRNEVLKRKSTPEEIAFLKSE